MKLKFLILFLLISSLIISSCEISNDFIEQQDAIDETKQTKEIIIENTKQTEILFCPRDECAKRFDQLINNAERSIHCALYDLDLEKLIHSFDEKSKEIDVKLVVDNENEEGIDHYNWIKFDNSNQLTHNKFCIIDNFIVTTGSYNPTKRGSYYNNNNFEIIYSINLAKNYEDEFQELWNENFGSGQKNELSHIKLNNYDYYNYFCPEDNCASHVKDFIQNSTKSIKFMVFSFTDHEIAIDIVARSSNNVSVKGIFEKTKAGGEYPQDDFLMYQGLNIKYDNNKYNLHHKVFIIDDEWVIFGSYNPTGNGNNNNDENIIITNDRFIVEKFIEEFNYNWNFNWPIVDKNVKSNKFSIYFKEVMYNPDGSDKGNEYIEIFNPTNKVISLDGYRIISTENKTKVIFGEIEPKTSLKIKDIFTLKNSNYGIGLFDRNLKQIDYYEWE